MEILKWICGRKGKDMWTEKEAKERAEVADTLKRQSPIMVAQACIFSAVQMGETECCFYGNLKEQDIKWLNEMGYDVSERFTQSEAKSFLIRWS